MYRSAMVLALTLLTTQACQCGNVASEEDARLAYYGIDPGIERMLQLGFDGFNAASSANIPTQSAEGGLQGEMQVGGQVDQGSSDNKGMRLSITLLDYADELPAEAKRDDIERIVYATGDNEPLQVDLNLRNIPDGTLQGTLKGKVVMSEGLSGPLELNLAFAGSIEQDPDASTYVRRVVDSTKVSGTAISDFGTFTVELTR